MKRMFVMRRYLTVTALIVGGMANLRGSPTVTDRSFGGNSTVPSHGGYLERRSDTAR